LEQLKLLGSQAPVSFERRKFPSTELCSVVSLAAFAVELKKMCKNGTLELQEQVKNAFVLELCIYVVFEFMLKLRAFILFNSDQGRERAETQVELERGYVV
jgi:hypothetical protein